MNTLAATTILPHLYEDSVKRIPDSSLVIFDSDLRGEGTRIIAHCQAKAWAFPDLWKEGMTFLKRNPVY